MIPRHSPSAKNDCSRSINSPSSSFAIAIISPIFNLLGITLGFYGLLYASFEQAGPWLPDKAALLPFFLLITLIIVLCCITAFFSVLEIAGLVRLTGLLITLLCTSLAITAFLVLYLFFRIMF